MASPSTTTLLEAVNRVLSNVGERRVVNLNSPVAQLCEDTINDVVRELSWEHDWEWARSLETAIWSNERAILTDVLKVFGVRTQVTAGSTVRFYSAHFLTREQFDTIVLDDYDSSTEPSNYPQKWTLLGNNVVALHPYPTDSAGQASVKFDVQKYLTPPALPSSTFPLPEQAMSLIYYKASSLMALKHLGDGGTAQAFLSLYEGELNKYKQDQGVHPAKGLNMYSRSRRTFA